MSIARFWQWSHIKVITCCAILQKSARPKTLRGYWNCYVINEWNPLVMELVHRHVLVTKNTFTTLVATLHCNHFENWLGMEASHWAFNNDVDVDNSVNNGVQVENMWLWRNDNVFWCLRSSDFTEGVQAKYFNETAEIDVSHWQKLNIKVCVRMRFSRCALTWMSLWRHSPLWRSIVCLEQSMDLARGILMSDNANALSMCWWLWLWGTADPQRRLRPVYISQAPCQLGLARWGAIS